MRISDWSSDVCSSDLQEEGRAANTMSTYEFALGKLNLKIGGLRLSEASAGRIDTALRAMSKQHGPTMARHATTILRGALAMAGHGRASWSEGGLQYGCISMGGGKITKQTQRLK